MNRDFPQIQWDAAVAEDCRQIVRLAIAEDLGRWHDWTTVALVAEATQGAAQVVARAPGVVCGLSAAQVAIQEIDARLQWSPELADGTAIVAGQSLASIAGSARSLLVAERLILNLMGRLSGIATLTARYVAAVSGTQARIYDTRKTTPGWRRLEKYAVYCGGGHNHRLGLHEAILIKDNHLALGAKSAAGQHFTPAEAVRHARRFIAETFAGTPQAQMIVEVEVDTLKQLVEVLPADPDIVLLDNMRPDELRQAVAQRDALNPRCELEASGGVNLDTIGAIARTGVERISVGALTHGAIWLDIGLDWTT